MVKELCDLCEKKEPNHRFKIKMSKKGYWGYTPHLAGWINDWNRYNKICICEDCAEKLFGILSNVTQAQMMKNAFKKKN